MNQWLFLFIGLLSACSPRTIFYLNEKAPFEKYKSYIIVRNPSINEQLLNDSLSIPSKIEKSLNQEMIAKNYKSSLQPDLVLRYEILANSQIANNTNNFNYIAYPVVNLSTFIQSTILLEMTDVKTKKLVWQASIDLKDLTKVTKKRDPVKEVVPFLFANFPYTAGTSTPQPTKKK